MADWSFQEKVIKDVLRALAHHSRVMLRAATAAGKTRIACRILRRYVERGNVIWFVVDRSHLARQAQKELVLAFPKVKIGVIEHGRRRTLDAQIQVCMVKSLPARMDAFDKPCIVVWDEAHHMAAHGWKKIAEAFPDAVNLGLSATPQRLDGKPLGDFFRDLVIAPHEAELERLGVLAPYKYFAPGWANLEVIEIKRGEYDREAAERVMTGAVLVGDMVQHYRRHADGRTAIAFAASKDLSRKVVERFNGAGIPAEHIDADTPLDQREATLGRLATGETKIVSNVEVFVEGLNVPAIGAVILLKPTKSLARCLQMIGRGRRVTDEYDDLIILDHAGLFFDHQLPNDERDWSLTEKFERRDDPVEASKRLRHCEECDCVHESAPQCPECGCVYTAQSRSIVEQRGALAEIILVPDGCETLAAFGTRLNVSSKTTLYRWRARGLPMAGVFVKSAQGEAWVAINYWRRPPPGCETQIAFERRMGVPKGTAGNWPKRGLPMQGVFVKSIEGEVWVAANARGAPPYGCENLAAFAKRIGASYSAAARWRKRGLPMCGFFVKSDEADIWAVANVRGAPPLGCETLTTFARRMGIVRPGAVSWIKRGLPMKGVFVKSSEGEAWVAANVRGAPAPGSETQAAFERRVGLRKGVVSECRHRGFPMEGVFVKSAEGEAWIAANYRGKVLHENVRSRKLRSRDAGASTYL